jgi:hypothetical protein
MKALFVVVCLLGIVALGCYIFRFIRRGIDEWHERRGRG